MLCFGMNSAEAKVPFGAPRPGYALGLKSGLSKANSYLNPEEKNPHEPVIRVFFLLSISTDFHLIYRRPMVYESL